MRQRAENLQIVITVDWVEEASPLSDRSMAAMSPLTSERRPLPRLSGICSRMMFRVRSLVV